MARVDGGDGPTEGDRKRLQKLRNAAQRAAAKRAERKDARVKDTDHSRHGAADVRSAAEAEAAAPAPSAALATKEPAGARRLKKLRRRAARAR